MTIFWHPTGPVVKYEDGMLGVWNLRVPLYTQRRHSYPVNSPQPVSPGRRTQMIEIEVAGGMCLIQFEPGMSTGRDDDINPGVGFMLTSDVKAIERDGKFYAGLGVFGRRDARRLRDMLDEFLAANP